MSKTTTTTTLQTNQQEKRPSQLPKIRIFQVIQKNMAAAGISPKLLIQSYPLNGKIFIGFVILGFDFTSFCVYLFNYAQTLGDGMQSIFICSVTIYVSTMLTIIILNVKKLFNLIYECEDFANISKWELSEK